LALNVFEDFAEKQKGTKLFAISYDQQRAYDSVQAFTIKASLERFNMPELFISYVLSSLQDATSCFKTFCGLTEDFAVEASVRQGDPLSPLVYICVVDALHEGWIQNPIYERKTGFVFSNSKTLRVASSGYADDAMIFASSWADIWSMHQWTREFCRVHGFNINSEKTKYVISDCKGENDPRWLPSVTGKERINPKPPKTEFRYLGVYISMSLTSSKQIEILSDTVMTWRWRSLANKIDPAQSVHS
jgi:hypothetical protein